MTTVQRRGLVYHGPTKVDNGYHRPIITDLPYATSQTTTGGGGFVDAGTPQALYPAGPPGGIEGTPYINTLTGDIYWWYNGQWNP